MNVTILGKPECHLCDDAEAVISSVLDEDGLGDDVTLSKRSILDDDALYQQYWEKIPVVFIDDEQHAQWRVDRTRFGDAVRRAKDSR